MIKDKTSSKRISLSKAKAAAKSNAENLKRKTTEMDNQLDMRPSIRINPYMYENIPSMKTNGCSELMQFLLCTATSWSNDEQHQSIARNSRVQSFSWSDLDTPCKKFDLFSQALNHRMTTRDGHRKINHLKKKKIEWTRRKLKCQTRKSRKLLERNKVWSLMGKK